MSKVLAYSEEDVLDNWLIKTDPDRSLVYKPGYKIYKLLDLSNRNIDYIPNAIDQLIIINLDLHNNALRYLPDSIGNLKNLKTLNVSNNELRELPDTIGNLENLTSLDLSNNKYLMDLPLSLINLSNLLILKVDKSLRDHPVVVEMGLK
jgi:Leucine-rich repeat (LRR) protein